MYLVSGGPALFRHELGAHLRRLRLGRGERLADTARRAGISPQYLSEIERGLKDPSSEMLEAVAGALEVEVGDVAVTVGDALRRDRVDRPAVAAVPAVATPSTSPAPASAAPQALSLLLIA